MDQGSSERNSVKQYNDTKGEIIELKEKEKKN